jgi:hypothetical protein
MMPTGPKGEKRPADAFQRAVKIARIATGEEADDTPPEAARTHGAKGGNVRAENLTPAKRTEIAKKGAAKRWKKTPA